MPSTAKEYPVIRIRLGPGDADLRPEGQRREGSRSSRMVLAGVLVLLAAVGAALLYAYRYWHDARQELVGVHDRLAAARAAQDAMLREIDETRQLLEAQRGELNRQEAVLRGQPAVIASQESGVQTQSQSLEQQRRSLREARESLLDHLVEASRRIDGGDPDRWLVAETESLLRTAGSLDVMHARDSVLRALRQADLLLARAGDEWQPARAVLSDEIAAVEAFRPPDVRTIAQQLKALDRRGRALELKETILPLLPAGIPRPLPVDTGVETRPKPRESVPQTAPGSSPGAVHAGDQDLPPALATRYGAYVRRHLRLAVDSARLGALNHDPVLYLASLNAASGLLTDFFAESPARDGIVAKLQRLAESPAVIAPPRTGRTLSLLESLPRRHAMP